MSATMEELFSSSMTALRDYFSRSRKVDRCGDPAQLVVFAEHAIQVSMILNLSCPNLSS